MKCPRCDSETVALVAVYGLGLPEGGGPWPETVPADGTPAWHCGGCGHEWAEDPVVPYGRAHTPDELIDLARRYQNQEVVHLSREAFDAFCGLWIALAHKDSQDFAVLEPDGTENRQSVLLRSRRA